MTVVPKIENSRRFVFILVLLALVSGLVSGVPPGLLIETYDDRTFGTLPVVVCFLWPGTIFGLFVVFYLRRQGVFIGTRAWVMVAASSASFAVTLLCGRLFSDLPGLPGWLELPLGAVAGSLFFMGWAAWLSRVYRSVVTILTGACIGGALMLAVVKAGHGFGDPDVVGLMALTAVWQSGFALTLGLLALGGTARISS